MGGFGRAGPHSALRLRRSNLHTNLVERPSRRPSPRLHHPTPCPLPSSAPAPRSCPTACVSRKVLTTRASPPSPSRYVTRVPHPTRPRFQSRYRHATRSRYLHRLVSEPLAPLETRVSTGGCRALFLDRPENRRGKGDSLFGSFPFLRDWLRWGCRPEKRRFGVSRKSEPARKREPARNARRFRLRRR